MPTPSIPGSVQIKSIALLLELCDHNVPRTHTHSRIQHIELKMKSQTIRNFAPWDQVNNQTAWEW